MSPYFTILLIFDILTDMKLGITRTEYNRIHKWAERKLTKVGKCFHCGVSGRTQWSNIDHEYRQEPTEYQEVCAKCHNAYDRQHLQIERKLGKRQIEYLNRFHSIYS